jgi:hypothetical protein
MRKVVHRGEPRDESIGPTLSVQGEPLNCICYINFEKHWGLVTQRRQNC